ncbi:metallophosphoesterase [Novosphingobium sp. CF614]|uniref:metallophosphoesterase n=1 Tax=Novosphingobium sp. CF614 TaxID=1884364 RepID=UPI000AEA90DF|nr:metallophosphoesterase [Novosphingobium sp. CF614]
MARPTSTKLPAVPAGERVYAIGDIHGRIDLFEALVRIVEADDARRGKAHTTIVLLGDLVDRGRDSAAVVARAREWSREREVEIIQGNHEEMLLASRDNLDALRGFLKFGGLETIMSYGVVPGAIMAANVEALQDLLNEVIPQDDFDFLASFKKMIQIGDYLFVHAGIRPDTPLKLQLGQDCRWIREPFLSHKGDFGVCVVHGHTITPQPEVYSNRIGIDTGAYLHGTLTAIGLQGTDRWFLQAHDREASGETSAAA